MYIMMYNITVAVNVCRTRTRKNPYLPAGQRVRVKTAAVEEKISRDRCSSRGEPIASVRRDKESVVVRGEGMQQNRRKTEKFSRELPRRGAPGNRARKPVVYVYNIIYAVTRVPRERRRAE